MTLTEFLLARIAEDEARDLDITAWGAPYLPPAAEFQVVDSLDLKPRWLAEREAKRRIVEEVLTSEQNPRGDDFDYGYNSGLLASCVLLALPYADHPDYDESWRP